MNGLSILLMACCVAQVPEPSPPVLGSPSQLGAPSAMKLTETDSRKVAFLEHVGPYWSMGPIIAKVANQARAMGVRDGLVIRYLDDPVAAPPGKLRTEIGFELSGTDAPKPPFQVAEWPAELVVLKQVNGPDGLSTRHFATLKAWARSQGMVPAGDMIARIVLSEGGESTAIERSEILLPVCVPDPPVVKAPPLLLQSLDREAEESESMGTPEFVGYRPATRIIQLAEADSPDRPNEDSIEPETPVQTAPPKPLEMPDAPAIAAAPPVRPSVPVRTWIDERKFPELAAAMLPSEMDPTSQEWADHMAARIVALANGVHRLSPDEQGWLGELATELAARRVVNRAEARRVSTRVIGPSIIADEREAERKALMLELDRLMSDVSYRALNPEQTQDRLILLIEDLPPLVSP